MKKLRITLKAKLLFFASFLLILPYLSYQYVWQLETYLRIGQEQTLVGTARAVATVLHERPSLFDKQSAFLSSIRPGKDLYAHQIDYPIRLDGDLQDWQEYTGRLIDYGPENLLEQTIVYEPQSLSFKHMVGRYDKFLYAMFNVIDDNVVYRPQNSLRIDRNDFVQIALISAKGEFERYAISPYKEGWVNAYRLNDDPNTVQAVSLETRIQGQWRQHDEGYFLELRFPLGMMSSKIAFAISDVDDLSTRKVELVMGTANPSKSEALGTVLVPSPEIENIVSGLKYSGARVWVVDKHMRVLARSGDIQDAGGIGSTVNQKKSQNELWQYLEERILFPLYYKILTKPPRDFIDDLADAFSLRGSDIAKALDGNPSTLWRLSSDNKAVILSASHPIYLDGQVMGAVVVEQTTHGIRSLRNQALEKQFHFILLVIVVASLVLLFFASRISSRITKLRDETESAIDANGRIVGHVKPNHASDEIGDLSRSFSQVLAKLSQYNGYLENMASRLSHELRTPVAVVSSSLDNVAMCTSDADRDEYIRRAKSGIQRLTKTLNDMSEATRLEQTIEYNEPEPFDLVSLLKNYVEGYNMTYPSANLLIDISQDIAQREIEICGSPDMFAQMLDKIVGNAKEFKKQDSDITMRFFKRSGKWVLSITNIGPILPNDMNSQLLNSMISIRKSTSSEQSHLGLGLYIANIIARYHRGDITIENLPDHSGVIVLVEFSNLH